jgi:hypothetical protein
MSGSSTFVNAPVQELFEELAQLPVAIFIDDLELLGLVDGKGLVERVRQSILGADAEVIERVARALDERPRDSWYIDPSIAVTIAAASMTISVQDEEVPTLPLGG